MIVFLHLFVFISLFSFILCENFLISLKNEFKKKPYDEKLTKLINNNNLLNWEESSCKFAIHSKHLLMFNTNGYTKSVFKFTEEERKLIANNISLSIMNIGPSGANTNYIHNTFCDMNLNSVHFDIISICNVSSNILHKPLTSSENANENMNTIIEGGAISISNQKFYDRSNSTDFISSNIKLPKKPFKLFNDSLGFQTHLHYCISTKTKCLISEILNNLKVMLLNYAMNYQALSDTPMDAFFPELLLMNPRMKVIMTLRDPVDWSKEKLSKQNHLNFMCNPHLWGKIRHPFDYLRCLDYGLKNKIPIAELFVNTNVLKHLCKDYNIDLNFLFAYAIIRQNTVNVFIYNELSKNKENNILPLCLFDIIKKEMKLETIKEEIIKFSNLM